MIPAIRTRMLGNLRNVDENLAKRVAAGLAMDLPAASKPAKAPIDMDASDALSILKQGDVPMKGRKVAILFAEGSDKAAINALKRGIESSGGTAFLVAPKIGELAVKGGKLSADGQLAGSPSVLFDAVACAISLVQAKLLANDGAALGWFMDAYGHCKTIGYCPATKEYILDKLGIVPDTGVVPNEQFLGVAPKRHWDREPKVRLLA